MKIINALILILSLVISGCASQKSQDLLIGGRSLDEHVLLYLEDVDPVKDAHDDFQHERYRFLYVDGDPKSLRPGLDQFLRCYNGVKSLRVLNALDAVMQPFMSFGRVESYQVSEAYQEVLTYIEQYNSEMERHILDADLDICNLLCNKP